MKVIQEPSKVALCDKCRAILGFENKDVNKATFSGGRHGGTKLYVKCPCCDNRVWIWGSK